MIWTTTPSTTPSFYWVHHANDLQPILVEFVDRHDFRAWAVPPWCIVPDEKS